MSAPNGCIEDRSGPIQLQLLVQLIIPSPYGQEVGPNWATRSPSARNIRDYVPDLIYHPLSHTAQGLGEPEKKVAAFMPQHNKVTILRNSLRALHMLKPHNQWSKKNDSLVGCSCACTFHMLLLLVDPLQYHSPLVP